MNIRITPFSSFRLQPKSVHIDNPNRLKNFNKPAESKTLLVSSFPTKKTPKSNLNNLLVFSKKTPAIRSVATADKTGLILYQQVERNKLNSKGVELVNRFHFKV